tara:strand:+ start:1764 stop:3149 length:1386 start_codon:yes stop_codon:yes gene_type:complete
MAFEPVGKQLFVEQGNFRATSTGGSFEPITEATKKKEKKGFLTRVGEQLSERKGKLKETFKRGFKQSPISTVIQTAGQLIGGAGDVAFEGLRSTFRTLASESVEQKVGEAGKSFLDSDLGKQALTALEIGSDAYGEFKKEHPTAAANMEGLANIVGAIPAVKGTQAVIKPVKTGIKQAKDVAESAVTKVKGVLPEKRGISKIEELVAPKQTKKEIERALEQGRVIRGDRGKVGTVILGKKPDIVELEDKLKRAAITVQSRIKNADKLTDAELAVKAKAEISSLAQTMKPTLQKTKVTRANQDNVLDSWLDVKQRQVDAPEYEFQPKAFTKDQELFERQLLKISDADNLDDIWKIRKDYDSQIKRAVKEADSKSPEATQFRREMWLDNRRILNGVIEDMTDLMEGSAKKSFDELEDLYRIRQNIISRADITKKGKPGLFVPANLLRGAFVSGLGIGGFSLLD